jgi:hypothetical protein
VQLQPRFATSSTLIGQQHNNTAIPGRKDPNHLTWCYLALSGLNNLHIAAYMSDTIRFVEVSLQIPPSLVSAYTRIPYTNQYNPPTDFLSEWLYSRQYIPVISRITYPCSQHNKLSKDVFLTLSSVRDMMDRRSYK